LYSFSVNLHPAALEEDFLCLFSFCVAPLINISKKPVRRRQVTSPPTVLLPEAKTIPALRQTAAVQVAEWQQQVSRCGGAGTPHGEMEGLPRRVPGAGGTAVPSTFSGPGTTNTT